MGYIWVEVEVVGATSKVAAGSRIAWGQVVRTPVMPREAEAFCLVTAASMATIMPDGS